jgi:hypothetical protein
MFSQLDSMLKRHPDIDEIIVTGHSLGGANATLAALVLAGFKRAGLLNPKLHCITFGAPKLFTNYTRDLFNSFLDSGIMTLDRVTNKMGNILTGAVTLGATLDLVPLIPPSLVHPGYGILKLEFKTQSKTGRSKNISDIRQMIAGISPGMLNFNEIPTYKEFLDNFAITFTQVEYKKIIGSKLFGKIGSRNEPAQYTLLTPTIREILQRQIIEPSPNQDQTTAAAEKGALTQIEAEGASAGKAELAADNQVNTTDEDPTALSGGGSDYKKVTLTKGTNQVVYRPNLFVSPVSGHMGYMGVSYNGTLLNAMINRPYLTTFTPKGRNMVISVVQQRPANIQPIPDPDIPEKGDKNAPTPSALEDPTAAAAGGKKSLKKKLYKKRKFTRRKILS